MFGLGFWEIGVIFLLLLVVTRPEDLPKLFRQMGEIYEKLQRLYYRIIDEIKQVEYKK